MDEGKNKQETSSDYGEVLSAAGAAAEVPPTSFPVKNYRDVVDDL